MQIYAQDGGLIVTESSTEGVLFYSSLDVIITGIVTASVRAV
jgi:hypothetical protein